MKSSRISSTPNPCPVGGFWRDCSCSPCSPLCSACAGLHPSVPGPGAPGPFGGGGRHSGGADHPICPAAPHLRLPGWLEWPWRSAGAVIQSVLSNPLAAPNIIGVNSGAGIDGGAVLRPVSPVGDPHPPGAFLGAFLGGGAGAVHRRAHRGQPHHPGAGRSGSFQSFQRRHRRPSVTFFRMRCSAIRIFASAGLNNLSMDRLIPSFCVIAAALIILFSLTSEMDILSLGRETAQSLGLPVKPLRLILLALAAALAGAARQFCRPAGLCGPDCSPYYAPGGGGRTAGPCWPPAPWGALPCSPFAICSPGCCSPPMRSRWASSSPWREGPSLSGCSCGREGGGIS